MSYSYERGTTPPTGNEAPKPRGNTQHSIRRQSPWQTYTSVWAMVGSLGLVVLAGGGTPVWARAFVLAGIGVWLMSKPPQETPSRLFDFSMLVLFIVAVFCTFAPASWLGHTNWRGDVIAMGVKLPRTNATAPWVATEAIVQLAAGIAWLYACWNMGLDHHGRKLTLWGLAGVSAVLAAGAIVCHVLKLKYPLAQEAMIFTYFPNRNQSGLWYCLGGIIAFGLLLESLRRKRVGAIAAGIMLLLCVLALVQCMSRMALALFALGTIALVLIRFGRDAGNYAIRILVPMAVFGLSMMVFFGRDTLDRIRLLGGAGADPDFRLVIWRDVLHMARLQPFGVGLGQFIYVFPQYRDFSRVYQAVLHPDSDWFWLLGETGWVGVAAAGVGVGVLLYIFLGRAGRASSPYRHMAALCAGLFFLHSLVDVPTHRFGTWLLAGLLLGLATPERPVVTTLFPRVAWRLAGVVFVFVGLIWLGAACGWPTETSLVDSRALSQSDKEINAGNAASAIDIATLAASVAPLEWWPYYQRGRAELTLSQNFEAALEDFRRDRYLEPVWDKPAYWEGTLWMPYNPSLAFAAWREAIQRETIVPEGLWRDITDRLKTLPVDYETDASILSKARPLFRYKFLMEVSPGRFPSEWGGEIEDDPTLSRYTIEERQDLFNRWATIDGAAASAYLDKHPNIIRDTWQVNLQALASAGKIADALVVARKQLPALRIPKFTLFGPMDEQSLVSQFQTSPSLEVGTTLLQLQLDEKRDDDALGTLDELSKLKPTPPFVSWWRSELLFREGRTAESWAALQPYLHYQLSREKTAR